MFENRQKLRKNSWNPEWHFFRQNRMLVLISAFNQSILTRNSKKNSWYPESYFFFVKMQDIRIWPRYFDENSYHKKFFVFNSADWQVWISRETKIKRRKMCQNELLSLSVINTLLLGDRIWFCNEFGNDWRKLTWKLVENLVKFQFL